MATEINAGRVAMVPKGEWSASTAYVRLDVVQYNGSSYVCKQDGTGQNPSTATTYWQLLASGVDPSNYYTKTETNTMLGGKQDALVSGQNIKSINGQSVLGAGDLELGELFVVRMTRNNSNSVYTADKSVSEIYEASYTNGKPVIAVMRDINNPVFILTDCDPDGDSYVFSAIESNSVTTLRWQRTDDYTYELETLVLQPHLVSGTNIKTVNNTSLLGGGNVDIVGKSAYQSYVDTTTDSPVKTEAEWAASLKGEDGVSLGEVAIADNQTTNDATKVLSARQGYLLGQKVNDLENVQTPLSGEILESAYFTQSSPTIVSYSEGFRVYYYPVKQGDKLKVTASEAQNRGFNYGFTTVAPAVNVSVTNATSVSTSSIDLDLNAPADGYFVVAKYLGYFTNIVVALIDGTIDTIRELQGNVESLSQSLDLKVDKEEGKTLILQDVADRAFFKGSEYLRVELDNEEKILGGRDLNGKAFENIGINTPNISVDGKEDSTLEDPEGRMEIKTDGEGKIISSRENDGTLIEKVGIKTNKLSFIDDAGLKRFRANINKVYDTITEAVNAKHIGMLQCGENIVVGMKELDEGFTAKEMEDAYRNILPNPVFPYIKKSSIHRLYDDAATPNMLYICSHSEKHIFYSICPTDTKRAFGSIDPGYYTKYNANYFYYADKNTPSDIHKVVLPSEVDGRNMVRRISYVLEMSNGDCLVEIANGEYVIGSRSLAHKNIYKVSNVFSGETIVENDVVLSLSFDKYLEKVSSFDNIVEYKAGHILLAPYSGTATGKVYISKDYGDSWDLIFCMDTSNSTHFIKPKAEHFGDENAYGAYPTPEMMNPGGELDWDTSINGNYHVHGIAYDPWYDRIWVVTGDGDGQLAHNITGIWWTDDEGYTWKRIGGGKEIHTQLIGVIPMEHCVLFPTDGGGNGMWRWSRNGKDSIIAIEEVYNYLGYHDSGLLAVGQRSIRTKAGFYLNTFAPNNYTQEYRGGVIATPNGYDFKKIFEDIYTEFSADTVEVGWGCDITDCGDRLILSAYQGGYIELNF